MSLMLLQTPCIELCVTAHNRHSHKVHRLKKRASLDERTPPPWSEECVCEGGVGNKKAIRAQSSVSSHLVLINNQQSFLIVIFHQLDNPHDACVNVSKGVAQLESLTFHQHDTH